MSDIWYKKPANKHNSGEYKKYTEIVKNINRYKLFEFQQEDLPEDILNSDLEDILNRSFFEILESLWLLYLHLWNEDLQECNNELKHKTYDELNENKWISYQMSSTRGDSEEMDEYKEKFKKIDEIITQIMSTYQPGSDFKLEKIDVSITKSDYMRYSDIGKVVLAGLDESQQMEVWEWILTGSRDAFDKIAGDEGECETYELIRYVLETRKKVIRDKGDSADKYLNDLLVAVKTLFLKAVWENTVAENKMMEYEQSII